MLHRTRAQEAQGFGKQVTIFEAFVFGAEARVWGFDDPVGPIPEDEKLQGAMDRYLAAKPPSHWRAPAFKDKVYFGPYKDIAKDHRKSGQMIVESTDQGQVQFNVILSLEDRMANIDELFDALQQHPMLAVGSSGQVLALHSSKDPNQPITNHMSPYNIRFRTAKLRTFEMGMSTNRDLHEHMGCPRLTFEDGCVIFFEKLVATPQCIN